MLEIAGYWACGKMLKLSSASCQTMCRCSLNLLQRCRKVDLFAGRSYITTVLKAYSSKFENNTRYEGTWTRLLLMNKLPKADSRYIVTDVSVEEVKDISETEMELDIKSLVDDLFEKAVMRDRMVATVPKFVITKHVTMLINGGFKKSDVLNLSKFPELIKNLAPLTDLIIMLSDYGISKKDIANIVNTYPDIIHKTKTDVLYVIEMLHGIGFTSDSIVAVICSYPPVLDSDLTGVPQRIEDLKVLFKTKDTFILLEKSPNLMFCDMGYILERFNYVFLEMGITQPQMKYSNLFSYPMNHIHARHMFVERAGFFKKMKKKKGQVDLNPKLETIIDTSDAEFVKKFGNMTVQDYQTFKKLLLKDRVIMTDVEDYPED